MDARMIFSQIQPHDSWGLLRAYYDTIATDRQWTLCGRLPDDQKERLRELIKSIPSEYVNGILDKVSGKDTGYHDWILFACYQYNAVYRQPWWEGYENSSNRYTTDNNSMTFDYVVDVDGEGAGDYKGIVIAPAVAQIILAEKAMTKSSVTVTWTSWKTSTRPSPTGIPCKAEAGLTGVYGYKHDSAGVICGCNSPTHIDQYTVEKVFECFSAVNPLIHTRDLWKVYQNVLMRHVKASMSDIIKAIAASRLAPRDWMAHFDTVPSDDYADVDIIVRA